MGQILPIPLHNTYYLSLSIHSTFLSSSPPLNLFLLQLLLISLFNYSLQSIVSSSSFFILHFTLNMAESAEMGGVSRSVSREDISLSSLVHIRRSREEKGSFSSDLYHFLLFTTSNIGLVTSQMGSHSS